MTHKNAQFQASNKSTIVSIINLDNNQEEEHTLSKSYQRLQDFLETLNYDYNFIGFRYEYD